MTYDVVGSAIEVHRTMGSVLLEKVYHVCMEQELKLRDINFLTELKVPALYKGKTLDVDFKCDFFVENCLVVELKAVQEIIPANKAQLLSYMKLLQAPKGILINFNYFKEGQLTFVNEYFKDLPDF